MMRFVFIYTLLCFIYAFDIEMIYHKDSYPKHKSSIFHN